MVCARDEAWSSLSAAAAEFAAAAKAQGASFAEAVQLLAAAYDASSHPLTQAASRRGTAEWIFEEVFD